jgi:hypothetical protein
VNATSSSIVARYVVTPQKDGCYGVSDTFNITINPLPVVSINDAAICPGVIRELSPNTGGVWVSDNPSVAELGNGYFVTGRTAGTATLTFTDNTTNCSSSLTVVVKAFPDLLPTTGSSVFCQDSTLILTNNSIIPTGYYSSWRKNNGNIDFLETGEHTVKVKGLRAGKSYVSYTVTDGFCGTTETYQVKVISNTPPNIKIGFEK